jgi:hypothetical protein
VHVVQQRDGTTRQETVELPIQTHDLLSWLFALRAQPGWHSGAVHTYHVWDGWKLVRLEARVGAVDAVWTGTGIQKAHAVTLSRTRLFHRGERALEARAPAEALGTAWFSIAPARVPVVAHLLAPLGEVRVFLESARTEACAR